MDARTVIKYYRPEIEPCGDQLESSDSTTYDSRRRLALFVDHHENMNTENVSGKQLPGGEFTVKRWMAYLWADATRNDDDAFRYEDVARERDTPRQLVPPGLAQQIINEASARVADVLEGIGYNLDATVLFGGQGFEFHQSLYVDEPYSVEGRVKEVVTKEGGSGEFDLVALEYEVFDDDGDLAYTSDKQLIVYPDS